MNWVSGDELQPTLRRSAQFQLDIRSQIDSETRKLSRRHGRPFAAMVPALGIFIFEWTNSAKCPKSNMAGFSSRHPMHGCGFRHRHHADKLFPRNPRLEFEEAASIL